FTDKKDAAFKVILALSTPEGAATGSLFLSIYSDANGGQTESASEVNMGKKYYDCYDLGNYLVSMGIKSKINLECLAYLLWPLLLQALI
ncbi:MAG TPA: hypothetical protein DEO84_04670, partial [candidate division Zixibacteria bacterium]|nr:hypothetical protein [candidate division Zixibacteria bacterium]HBZ00600.1 hypothetical protein [candidate division Zixibacteria bacterium]